MGGVNVQVGGLQEDCQGLQLMSGEAHAGKALAVPGLALLHAGEAGIRGAVWVLWHAVAQPKPPLRSQPQHACHAIAFRKFAPGCFLVYLKLGRPCLSLECRVAQSCPRLHSISLPYNT